jgi:hypothetical protein
LSIRADATPLGQARASRETGQLVRESKSKISKEKDEVRRGSDVWRKVKMEEEEWW